LTKYVIETNELTKFYGQLNVVHRLNLCVPKGSIFGFLGPNGAGKSTTIKCIMNLIRPSSGTIKIFDQDPKRNFKAIFKRIGYLPEFPTAYSGMSVYSFLKYMGRLYGITRKNIKYRVLEALDFVNLGKRAEHPADKLSAGQKQRLGIAAAIVHDPELLILDEPSANLDPLSRFQLFRQLKELVAKKDKERTIIISSHILPEVERLADHFAIINTGTLVMEGELEKINTQIEGVELLLTVDPADKIFNVLELKPYIKSISLLDQKHQKHIQISLKRETEEIFQKELPNLLLKENARLISLKPVQAPIERAFLQALQRLGDQT
jgi:ABC-2 type transport system ATP-binding protein